MLRFVIILALIILNGCNSSDKIAKLNSDCELEKRFEQLTFASVLDSIPITFRLDTLTTFAWDSVIILTPYYPIDRLERELNIDLTEIKKTSITSDEISNVLAFIKNGQLINYVDLPRGKGDFPQFQNNHKIFTPDNCIFELEQKQNGIEPEHKIFIIKAKND